MHKLVSTSKENNVKTLKITTGPIKFEQLGQAYTVELPEGITIEASGEEPYSISGGSLELAVEDIANQFEKIGLVEIANVLRAKDTPQAD